MTKQKIWDIILVCFSVYWTVFFLLDYWDKHPNHVLAFQYFRYTKLCVFLVSLGAGLSYLITKQRTGLISKLYNGLSIYVLGIIIVTAITLSYNKYLNLDIGITNYFHLYGRLSINFLTGYFVILACYSTGNLILKRFYSDVIKHKHFTYDFGLGAIIVTMLLFIIGAIGQLKMIVVLPILLLFIGINYKGSFDFVMDTFIRPFKIKKENGFVGYFCLFVLFAFLILNFFAIDLPFPLGFDSRNLYINIANQIGITNELVSGYQPYSWSLFLSQGFILFNKVETTLFLSFITGVFCLIATYHFSKNYLKLTFINSCLLTLVTGLIPTFANQYFVELKTDFGLLFYQILAILLMMELFSKLEFKDTIKVFGIKRRNLKILILIGLFLGFGLSIKLLNLFLIYAFLIVIWRTKGKIYGSIGLLLILFSILLILGLNNLSGLGKYHLGNEVFKWIYLIAGLVLFSSAFAKNIKHGIHFTKQVAVVGCIAALPLMPWIGKNFLETKSLSPTKLLLGDHPGPGVNIFTIDRNYRK